MTRLNAYLVFFSLVGWFLFWIILTFDLFAGAPNIRQLVQGVGLTITAITFIFVVGGFLLRTVLSGAFQIQPSRLVSACVYSLFSVIVLFVLLSNFGVDVGAILTTSAIVGAVVGLSMQSTLGSIIAGMSMSAEPLLKIGSAILYENRTVYIEQKTWRHIVGRRLDNVKIMIPNSMLANMRVLVLPEDGPTRLEVFLHLPPDVPPQQITDLLSQAFTDFEQIDASRPVVVTPIETQPEVDSIQYRIRLWAHSYSHVTILHGEVLRRAWYVLDRANIHQPRNQLFESRKWPEVRLATLERIIHAAQGQTSGETADLAIKQYRFAPSEVLHFSRAEAGRSLIVVRGEVRENGHTYLNTLEHGRRARPHLPALGVQKLTTPAIVRKIADRLAIDTGPIANRLVRDSLKSSKNLNEVLEELSNNILDEQKRNDFLSATKSLVEEGTTLDKWAISSLEPDASGRVSPNPELRAVTEVLAVTFLKQSNLVNEHLN